MNQTHPNQTSHLFSLIWTLVFSSNQYVTAQSLQWLGHMLEGLGLKFWQKQENYLFSKTSDQPQHPPSLQLKENQSFFSGSKVARADSLTIHICLVPSLKISGAIPPLNMSASWHIVGLLYFTLTSYLCTYLSRGPFWSYKGTFVYISYPLHAHYMTHLFHLHWSNYINIMKSYNNETHINFWFLLLLAPSISHIFSW